MKITTDKHFFAVFAVLGMLFSASFAENVPTNYIAYSIEEMIIGDRAGTTGEGFVGSADEIRVGSEAKVYGSIVAQGDVQMYDRDTVFGDVSSAANVIKHSGAYVTGTTEKYTQVPVYTIPTRNFSTGTQDIRVYNDDSLTMQAGVYDTIWVFDRG